jgi:histidinol-phosphate aminotransferase
MSAAFMNEIRSVEPYVPGDQPNFPDMIKLNTNENPYPPAPAVEQVLHAIPADTMRLYPDPTVAKLNQAIADCYHVAPEQVFTGVGSDDVLAMCFLTFFNSEKPILFPDVSYGFYPVWAEMLRIPHQTQPLDADFCIRKEDYYKENGGIVFPNPNAPTGIALSVSDVEDIIRHNPDSIVIVDEAYIDFGGTSVLPLVETYDNLIVVQTFSKSRSMAGMRIGFAISNPTLIQALNNVKFSFNSYTMNQTAIAAGVASIQDTAYFQDTISKIVATRERTKTVLTEMGFQFPDSQSNFLFVTHPDYDAKTLYEMLKAQHIFVRYFGTGRTAPYLRITIGTDEQMDALFAALRSYCK